MVSAPGSYPGGRWFDPTLRIGSLSNADESAELTQIKVEVSYVPGGNASAPYVVAGVWHAFKTTNEKCFYSRASGSRRAMVGKRGE